MKDKLKAILRVPGFYFPSLKKERHPNIVNIVESSDWIVRRIGIDLAKNFNAKGFNAKVDTNPAFYKDKILHFGTLNTVTPKKAKFIHPSNLAVGTIYHGNFGINSELDHALNNLRDAHTRFDHFIASTNLMKSRLVSWGLPDSKISVIPIGFHLEPFKRARKLDKDRLREKYNIPRNSFCIGSFQKDGNGWGEGLMPKLIKGPDIFVKTVENISKQYPIHILLSGPSRGYVKKELEKRNISYTHFYAKDHEEITYLYQCLDLYLVTSREEGGPLALLESTAAGVPLVTTNVGMAPDILSHQENAMIAEVENIPQLVSFSKKIIEDNELKKKLIQEGLKMAENYDYSKLIDKYISLYTELFRLKSNKK